jgi:hypothetical protein
MMIARPYQKSYAKVPPPPSYLFFLLFLLVLLFCRFNNLCFSFFFLSVVTTIQDREANKPGSSTNDKKNRRKWVAINLNQGKKLKKLKLDEETKSVYEKYISKRFLKKSVTKEEILEA